MKKQYLSQSVQIVSSQLVRPAQYFFRNLANSSVLLLLAAAAALLWANSPFSLSYHDLIHAELTIGLGRYQISKSLLHWINDGLMTYFFFTVGLEIKRELLVGELASLKRALLPLIAAVGGMVVPGIIFFVFNRGTDSAAGWGIPMATDIAFALGAIAVFGKRLPMGLRVFLSAFAIADDIGAVLIIALFYTKQIVWQYLLVVLVLMVCLAAANLLWIRWTPFYALTGLGIWFAALGSGLHPTVAGIVVAFFIPARGKYDTDRFVQRVNQIMAAFKCEEQSCGYSILLNRGHLNAVHDLELACHDVETPLQRLEHSLHSLVAFGILPVFAFANAGVTMEGINLSHALTHPLNLGIVLGLFLGKPLGVTLFAYLAVRSGLAALPYQVSWPQIVGAGMLGGIGFTMSLFIVGLSFTSVELLNYAKLAILVASFLSAVGGIVVLALNRAELESGMGELESGQATDR